MNLSFYFKKSSDSLSIKIILAAETYRNAPCIKRLWKKLEDHNIGSIGCSSVLLFQKFMGSVTWKGTNLL